MSGIVKLWHSNCSIVGYQAEFLELLNLGGGVDVNKRMTITEVAEIVGICPKTIVRWEKVGKVRRAKRDWRGWRIYDEHDLDSIREFRNTVIEA